MRVNTEEVQTVLAKNRLRHAYLTMVPELEPYFSTGTTTTSAGWPRPTPPDG